MVNLPGTIFSKKLPLPPQQLTIANSFVTRGDFMPTMTLHTGIGPGLAGTGLVHEVSQLLSSYVQLPCCVQKTLFSLESSTASGS